MTIQETIEYIITGHSLTREEAGAAMQTLMSGEATPAQSAAFLIALRMRGETVEEITGLAETMRALATPVKTSRSPLVDTCGTGGDRSGTFNISTAAAFVVAGAGVGVAKHGNRSATSKCGSADVLEALGVRIDCSAKTVGHCIDEAGIGFLFARYFHSAMKHVAPVRVELGVRTVFNVLGPLTNPAGADGQVMGVFDGRLIETLANVLLGLGARHAFVVAGSDGLDELTLTGPSRVAEACGGEVTVYEITPEQFGLERCSLDVLTAGEAAENAAVLTDILKGKQGPHRDITLLNAAPAIVAGQSATDLAEGLEKARKSIDSGAALAKLEQLAALSQQPEE